MRSSLSCSLQSPSHCGNGYSHSIHLYTSGFPSITKKHDYQHWLVGLLYQQPYSNKHPCVAGRHMFVIPIRELLGPRGLMSWPTWCYSTAVIAAPIAGDSSARACQVGDDLLWHLLMEGPFQVWSRQWPWYSWRRIKTHNYCFKKERLVACASHPSYQIIRLKLIIQWTLLLCQQCSICRIRTCMKPSPGSSIEIHWHHM